MKQKILLI